MVKPTTEFVTFEKRLNELKSFIPVIPPGLSITTAQLDSASAFVVLTHAACEEFMENRVQKTVDEAKKAFEQSGKLGRVVKHLCVFPFVKSQRDDQADMMRLFGAKGFGVSVTPTFQTASASVIKTMVTKGHKEFSKAVRDNHGAGSAYQFRLLCAIGFDVGDFGPTFSSILAQLVTDRGFAAHTHVATAKTLHDPSDLAKWPAELIAGYKVMDKNLSKLVTLKS